VIVFKTTSVFPAPPFPEINNPSNKKGFGFLPLSVVPYVA